jgi:hypothetical protein
MSYSLKREIELYVNTVDSTDGVCKIAVLPEFELKIQANLLQVYRKIIGEDPEMLPRAGVDQISPVSLGFLTYLKPALLDGLIGHTAPEKLFWDSLGGIPGYRGKDYYKVNFGRVNRLLPLYFFIKTTTAIYKVNKVYVDSVELSFDINYILIGKWTAQAISLEAYKSDEIIFTNIKDYTNVDNYIRNKFTKLNITDSKDNKIYNFPITESVIKIQNTLMPVYDKNIKVVVGTVKDLIVGGRAVSGSFKSYLSGKFKHSRDFLDSINEDLTQVNRKYKIEYIAEDRNNSILITLPHAYINVPNLDFEDVLNVNIEFTSAESVYGANDDLDIKYITNPLYVTYTEYNDYIQTYKGYSSKYKDAVKLYGAVSHWRCNDNGNTEIRDQISDKHITVFNSPLNGLSGPLCNDETSKAFKFTTASSNQQYANQDLNNIKCDNNNSWAFWVKINEDIQDGISAILTGDYWDEHSVPLYRDANGDFFAGVGGIFTLSGIPPYYWIVSIGPWNLDLNKWHFLAVTYDKVNGIGKMYKDGVLVASITSTDISNYAGTRAIYINYYTPNWYQPITHYNNMDISEISVFNYVLSDNHIKSLYYLSGCGPGFNIENTPISKSYNISGKIPTIFIGVSLNPVSTSITLRSGSLIGTTTIQINPQHTYLFCRKYALPEIHTSSIIVPTNNSVSISSTSSVIIIGKRILPQVENITIRKYNVSINKKYSINTGTLLITEKYPLIINTARLIRVLNGSLYVSNTNIPVVKEGKSIKPSKGTLNIYTKDRSLELYYKFNEQSGSDLLDYSGYGRDAVLYNTPTLYQNGPHANKKSIYFSRASLEHAIYGYSLGFPSKGAISLWVYPVGQQNYDICFHFNYTFNQGNNINYFRFYRENNTSWLVMPFASGSNSNWQVTVNDNEWTHIGITWDTTNNTISTYKNGSVVTNNGSHSSWPSSLQPLGICRGMKDGSTYYWNGYLSSFSLHNSRLTSSDMLSIYNNSYDFDREAPIIYITGPVQTGHLEAVGNIPTIETQAIIYEEEVIIVFI